MKLKINQISSQAKTSAKQVTALDVWDNEKGITVARDLIPEPHVAYWNEMPTPEQRDDLSNFKEETVPTSKLVTPQSTVNPNRFDGAMQGLAGGKLPKLIPLSDGTYLVDDGNHRVSKQILDGATSIRALVFQKKPKSVVVKAATRLAEAFKLSRSGFRTYSTVLPDGRRVKVQQHQAVVHGTFPAGSRQKREPRWYLTIDGEDCGSAATLAEATELAKAHLRS